MFHFKNKCSGTFKLVMEDGKLVLRCNKCGNRVQKKVA